MLPFQIKSASKYFLMEKFSILIQNCIILWMKTNIKKLVSTWSRRKSVVLLKPALAHSMTSHFHNLIIPLNIAAIQTLPPTSSQKCIFAKMNVNREHFISFEFSGNITFIICCLPFSWIVEWMRCIIVEQWAALQILQAMNGALQSFRSYYCKEIVCT